MSEVTVLVVDDDRGSVESLEKILARESFRVLTAFDAKAALELLRTHRVHVVLTDLMMPGTTGLELLRAARQISPVTEVVLMTAFGSVESAVSAMRDGAYDFVEKPLKRHAIVKSVRKAAERGLLVAENQSLRETITQLTRREAIGNSAAFRQVVETATHAAPSMATVLVLGESGTGKELLARLIHERSLRAKGPFVAVNCAALPESILESELFGHERGAFTGAVTRKDGRFAKASGGTLFLDEIGELSQSVQVKLLRVLQEGEYEPVGGDTVRADVRVVAATNRDLQGEVQAGRFREDLYYRLSTFIIHLPALRERTKDIEALALHFLKAFSHKTNKKIYTITKEALHILKVHTWPGNIRELKNVLERSVILENTDVLTPQSLPHELCTNALAPALDNGTTLSAFSMASAEKIHIQKVLNYTGGNKAETARLLNIGIATLYRKIDEYNLSS